MNLNLTLDADAGGLIGAVRKATATVKDFGIVGGPPVLAVKAAVAGVEKAFAGAAAAGRLAGRAVEGFAAAGKGAVALMNQINGAVELANKVIPALMFPLEMAENAGRAKSAFDELKTSWQGVAGALGEGINDALIPILKAAGVEVGNLKEQAREVGKGIGDAIDFTRVSYQMGTLPEILWVGLQKVTLQWGASLIEFFTTFGFKVQRIMDDAISGAIAWALDAMGADEKATSMRAGSDARQASSVRGEADALAGVKDFLSPVYEKIGELGDEMAALSAPVKAMIGIEKASEAAFNAFNKALQTGLDLVSMGGGESKDSGKRAIDGGRIDPQTGLLPAPVLKTRLAPVKDPLAFQGPMLPGQKAPTTAEMKKDMEKAAPKALPPPGATRGTIPMPTAADARKFRQDKRDARGAETGITGVGFGGAMAQLRAKRMGIDPAALARTATNRTSNRGADKAEREAQQKDAKATAAADAVAKSLPMMAADIAAVKAHLSKIQSR